jgi:hypothetical protein
MGSLVFGLDPITMGQCHGAEGHCIPIWEPNAAWHRVYEHIALWVWLAVWPTAVHNALWSSTAACYNAILLLSLVTVGRTEPEDERICLGAPLGNG